MILVSPHFQNTERLIKLGDGNMSVKMMIKCTPVMKSCILYFILFSSFFTFVILFFTLLIKEVLRTFRLGSTQYKDSNNTSARE